MEVTVFYNLTLEVRSQHSCYIPFTRSKFPDLSNTQGKGLHQEVGITGSHFRTGLLLFLLLLFCFFQYLCYKLHNTLLSFLFRRTIPGALHSFGEIQTSTRHHFPSGFPLTFLTLLVYYHTHSLSAFIRLKESLFHLCLLKLVYLFVCFCWVQNSRLTVFFFQVL